MIKRLKIKLIALITASLFVLLAVIVTGMNVINYNSVVSEADGILDLLSQNKGVFPSLDGDFGVGPRGPMQFSPELPYESRYFSVLADTNGNIIGVDTSRIALVDTEKAIEYTQKILSGSKKSGFLGDYRFTAKVEDGTVRVTFLDVGRKLDSFKSFLYTSITISLIGLVVVFFVIVFFSGKIINPIAEAYEKQKRFITDAGHEIKTPLTIINADTDILEMEVGENEYLTDIKQQAKRLTSLTNDLVYLARMEESENTLTKIDFPVSDVVFDTVNSFKTLLQSQNKTLECNIQPMLSLCGNSKAIEQLVSILMENAVKYSPENTAVNVNLSKQGRNLCLSVHNVTENAVSNKDLQHVFDRFYRTDTSRNSQTGGHGIGLSVAKAIVTAHSGKICAYTQDGHSFVITAVLPI